VPRDVDGSVAADCDAGRRGQLPLRKLCPPAIRPDADERALEVRLRAEERAEPAGAELRDVEAPVRPEGEARDRAEARLPDRRLLTGHDAPDARVTGRGRAA